MKHLSDGIFYHQIFLEMKDLVTLKDGQIHLAMLWLMSTTLGLTEIQL